MMLAGLPGPTTLIPNYHVTTYHYHHGGSVVGGIYKFVVGW